MTTNRYQGQDPILTELSLGYTNDAYIAPLLLPDLPVKFQSGKHWKYNRGKYRSQNSKRAAGSNSKEVTYTFTSGDTYYCEDHALKTFVLDEDVKNAQTPTSPFEDATEHVTELLMVERELEMAAMLTSTSNITQNTTLSGTSQLSDPNSDPFSVIETGKQTIHSALHLPVNTVVMGKQVWDKLKYHPALMERIKYTKGGVLTTDMVAALFEVDRIIVASAGYNNTNEGQTDSMTYIWGKDILLAHIAPKIGQKMLTLGLNYKWTGATRKIERLRGTNEEDRKGTFVRAGDDYYDQRIVSAECGYLIKSAVA